MQRSGLNASILLEQLPSAAIDPQCPLRLERCTRQTLLRVSMSRTASRRSFRRAASGIGVLSLDAVNVANVGGGGGGGGGGRAASNADVSGLYHHQQQAPVSLPCVGAPAPVLVSAIMSPTAMASAAASSVVSAALEEERASASCFYAVQDDGSSAVPVDVRNNNMGERLRPLHGVTAPPPLVLEGRVLGPHSRPGSGRILRVGSTNGASPLPRASTAGGGVLGALVEVCEEDALRARASAEAPTDQQPGPVAAAQQLLQQPAQQPGGGGDVPVQAVAATSLRPETASTDSDGSGGTAAAPPTTTAGSTLNTSLARSSYGDILPNLVNTGGGAGATISIGMELQSRMPSYAESTATGVTDCGGSLFNMPPPPSMVLAAADGGPAGGACSASAAAVLAQHPSRRRLGGHHLLFRNSPAGSSYSGSASNTASGAAPDAAKSDPTCGRGTPFAQLSVVGVAAAAGADGAAATSAAALQSRPSSLPSGASPRAAAAHAHHVQQHHPTTRSCLSAVTHAHDPTSAAAAAAASTVTSTPGRLVSVAAMPSRPASLSGCRAAAMAAASASAADAAQAHVLATSMPPPAAVLDADPGGVNSRPATARDVSLSLGALLDTGGGEEAGTHATLEVVYRLTGETGSCMAVSGGDLCGLLSLGMPLLLTCLDACMRSCAVS